VYRIHDSNEIIQLGVSDEPEQEPELNKITHIMHAMKDLSALVSLFQLCLGVVSSVAPGENDQFTRSTSI
jgi:hypothetical protein